MAVRSLGYSERGIINAICDDISRCADASALKQFLNTIQFRLGLTVAWDDIDSATLLAEQSFSVFGDADLVLLVQMKSGESRIVFFEAKVSGCTPNWTTIEKRWEEFQHFLAANRGNTSNLFVQLHRKVRLVDFLRDKQRYQPDTVAPMKLLGENPVVLRAGEMLRQHLQGEIYFVAILPDPPEDLTRFFAETIPVQLEKIVNWNLKNWGYVSWRTLDASLSNPILWSRTRATFEWNQGENNSGQIIQRQLPTNQMVESGQIREFDGSIVYVVKVGKYSCRVADMVNQQSNHFWKTRGVPKLQLGANVLEYSDVKIPHLPTIGKIHEWRPSVDIDHTEPYLDAADLQPGTHVEIIKPSWKTTRVRSKNNKNTFVVYTHDLLRTEVGS